MPAYSFKERFCPFVADGSKPHTCRAKRKGRQGHARPGQTVYLYYGMRTKWCKKIGEGTCIDAQDILITHNRIRIGEKWLSFEEMDQFAWRDGFRPEGSTADNAAGAWSLMYEYWCQENTLPWCGEVIYWKLKPESEWKTVK